MSTSIECQTATQTSESSRSIDMTMQHRAKELRNPIDFIPNADFTPDADWHDEIEQTMSGVPAGRQEAPSDLPAHLKRMCEADLLTREQESSLFRLMNWLKYRAEQIRSQLDFDSLDYDLVEQVDALLCRAERIRDLIINANMRLVISIVKKFVTPQNSFDEMLSDGTMILMQAVNKFDFDRGFRFSTYAYRSIARNAYQTITATQKEEALLSRDSEDWAFEQQDGSAPTSVERAWSTLRDLLGNMMTELDRREQFIIRSRYALGAHRKTRTFQFMADKLGISKERVRQLEQRAVAKMQTMATEFDLDELCGPSVV